MKISRSMVAALASIVVLSMLVAHVLNLITFEEDRAGAQYPNLPQLRHKPMNNTARTLWFAQISDIHISKFRDFNRANNLATFLKKSIIGAIKPAMVLVTGDLTDAKTSDNIGSRQYEEEWKLYKQIINNTEILDHTIWLDIRGNHDNFNVLSDKSSQNFYRNYSVQGKKYSRSYLYQIKKEDVTYSFIGMDACLDPGPRRPFNFVGMLEKSDINQLQSLIEKIEKSESAYTIWFGHFPTSCILSQGIAVRKLIGSLQQGFAYLCGHLHRLGGLVPYMYTLQKDGFLELELGDWKDNRIFRLMAIDNGEFTFVDNFYLDDPFIMVTHPKNAQHNIPGKTDVKYLQSIEDIRILVFHYTAVTSVKVKLDDGEWLYCKNVDGPLWVHKFIPNVQAYSKGLHKITVIAEDNASTVRAYSHYFSLDGTTPSFGILSKLVLMTDASTIFKVLFGLFLVLSILPLCVLRYVHSRVVKKKMKQPIVRISFFRNWLRRMWLVATVDRIFYPLIFYGLYLTVGPWSIGHIIEDHIGVIFAWGIFVNGAFLPGSFTYAYGCYQIITFQIPITIILGYGLDKSFDRLTLKTGKKMTHFQMAVLHTPFVVMFSLQVLMAYFFLSAYGIMAFILGPLRTWSCILAIYLWYQALRLPEKCIKDTRVIWNRKKMESDISLDSRVSTSILD